MDRHQHKRAEVHSLVTICSSLLIMPLQIMGQPGVSAFLQSVLRDLSAVISMGHDLFLDFNSELKILKKMLLRLQDVLVDGERRRVVENPVDEWMDELKDLLYDADDLLDEINMGKQQLQQASDGQPSNTQVRHNFSSLYSTSNIIKSTLGEVLGRIEELEREAVRLDLKRDVGLHSANWIASQALNRPKSGSFADESEIHGREKDKYKIIEMLLAEDGGMGKKNYDVVCLVGMSGLGKTTLAQRVFQDDERICSSFAVKGWACVSDVFDVVKVIKELIESAEGGDGISNMQSLAGLQARLKSVINKKRFLLVLDDVWTTNEWDNLKAPLNFGAKGSKILVTTRHRNVAESLSNKTPYQLGRLEDQQCQAIFNDNAFGEMDEIENDSDLMKIGAEIVRKCGGVPLVTKVIGAMLKGEEDESKWKAVNDNDLWNLAYKHENLYPGLRLSYFYLPSVLKRCFEYFALFPSDFRFKQDELVRMWMAEGFIEVKEGSELEEIGSQYYNDLKGRSLIQENNMMHDMVHHLACTVSGSSYFRDKNGSNSSASLASVRHASIEYTSQLLFDANKLRTLIYRFGSSANIYSYKKLRVLRFKLFSDPPSSISCDLKHLRYLHLGGYIVNCGILDTICMLTNLQVLDLSYCRHLQSLPQAIGMLSNLRFLGLKSIDITRLPESVCSLHNLRVLDLSNCLYLTNLPMDIDPPNSICMLSKLKELNLSGCFRISSLPESLCNLDNLQVLNLCGCTRLTTLSNDIGNLKRLRELKITRIARLPKSIVNATNLRVLDGYNFNQPLRLLGGYNSNQPPHLGKLTKLERLDSYYVGTEEGLGIDELKDMNSLKGSLTIWNMENIRSVEEALVADLKSKKRIEELKFLWVDSSTSSAQRDGEVEMRVIEVLEPHVALKRLVFDQYIGHKFPGWMSSTRFYNLTELYVWNLPKVTKMEGMVFQSLKVLILRNCPALMEVSMTTSKLAKLEVSKCKELKPAALVLLPQFWDVLHTLECDYCHLDYLLQQMKATNASPCTKLKRLGVLVGGDNSITSLPVGFSTIFTSVGILAFEDLPPTNFKNISVGASESLESIKELKIHKCPGLVSLNSFVLPPILKSLTISDCANLKNLPFGLCNLNTLENIRIFDCPNLEISSDDALPPSITYKSILNCPILEEQLKWEDSRLDTIFFG